MRLRGFKVQKVWRLAVLLFITAVLLVPNGVSAESSGGIGLRVANPDPNNPRSKSIFIYTLERGESKQDQLLVVNPTDEEQIVTLGSVDGVVTNSGDYTCRQEVEPVTDSGAWVQFSTKKVTVPANGEKAVDFTIKVPANADVGEHNSCLTLPPIKTPSDDGSGVRLQTRQAIRMSITIPGDLTRKLSIEKFDAHVDADGIQKYTLTAANKGNVSADIDMKVRLVSLFNKEVASAHGEYPIVPNENLTRQLATAYQPLFGGWYTATPTIRYDKRLGAFGTQNSQATYETITGDPQTILLLPTQLGWLIIALVALLLAGMLWYVSSRKRTQYKLKQNARTYTVKSGDTLQKLAVRSQVGWKDLARLNKLRAPYSLEEGQKILLPGAGDAPRRGKVASNKR